MAKSRDSRGNHQASKRRIGVLERVSIPEWNLHDVEARIDTGAYTSSIDASRVVLHAGDAGKAPRAEITFGIGKERHTVNAAVVGFRKIRNPSGVVTIRPIVQAVISMAGKRFRTVINLHRRDGMTYRMIIGRRALAGRFVVEVTEEPRRGGREALPGRRGK